MKCLVCGRPLIGGSVSKQSGFIAGVKLGQYNRGRSVSYTSLTCPTGDSYDLTDISGEIKRSDINISEEIVIQLEEEKVNLNLEKLISCSSTKVYTVNYSFITRLKNDHLKFNKKPSPSNEILDKIGLYICGWTKRDDQEKEDKIVFALVSDKKRMGIYEYNIVWFYIE